VYRRVHRSGQTSWVVDLGELNGKRDRHSFKSKDEANTFAEQARIKRQNEGLSSFNLSSEIRGDAFRATEVLKPHGVTLSQAAEYYVKHVAAYQSAPFVSEIVKAMLSDAEANERRVRTIEDLRSRLHAFADEFPETRLIDIRLQDIKEWISDEGWSSRTKINYMTKVSQLYNYARKHRWIEQNLIENIDRPDVQDDEPGILTVTEAKSLLEKSINFGLRAYISIGLLAGLRSAELMRLKGDAIKLEEKVIIVGADVAKKRSRRVVEMCDALIEWLKPVLPINGAIVESSKFRENMDALKKAAEIKDWPHNGLRHSFGSYHLAFHGDQIKTAAQMGHRDAAVVHNHYKALVLKSEAEKYWSLS
jgi:integrase